MGEKAKKISNNNNYDNDNDNHNDNDYDNDRRIRQLRIMEDERVIWNL